MNEKDITAMEKALEDIARDIVKLQREKAGIESFLARKQIELKSFSSNDVTENNDKVVESPTKYLRNLFNDNPDKQWTPKEIADLLKENTASKSKNLIASAHSYLQRMLKDGEIEKGGQPRKSWYRKKRNVFGIIDETSVEIK